MNHPKSMFQLSGVHYRAFGLQGFGGLEFRAFKLQGLRVQGLAF